MLRRGMDRVRERLIWRFGRGSKGRTHMEPFEGYGLIAILLIGGVAGWLAGLVVRGYGLGVIGNVIVGVIGAFVGSWLLAKLGIFVGSGLLGTLVGATIGAIVLLLIIGLFRRV
jgi:uncharacterized membrane protein YeaQ/YmgE (transglycosylase-associated protein family)